MRGLVIAALAAIFTLSGCAQPQPQLSIAAPTSEGPPIAVEDPTAGATTTNPAAVPANDLPPIAVEDLAPSATTTSPVAAPTSTVPPTAFVRPTPSAMMAGRVTADAGGSPTAVPPASPTESASVALSSQPPTARSSLQATASSAEQSMTPAKPPVAVTMPAEPLASAELDLAGLEQRLRDTRAIGVFTKLSLKNQVDDLVGQFRGFYQGQIQVPLAELRKRYELLLLKVLTLLQDTDQQLANAIASSREAIWGILADPQKFANI